jgi:hypothetical protein
MYCVRKKWKHIEASWNAFQEVQGKRSTWMSMASPDGTDSRKFPDTCSTHVTCTGLYIRPSSLINGGF